LFILTKKYFNINLMILEHF